MGFASYLEDTTTRREESGQTRLHDKRAILETTIAAEFSKYDIAAIKIANCSQKILEERSNALSLQFSVLKRPDFAKAIHDVGIECLVVAMASNDARPTTQMYKELRRLSPKAGRLFKSWIEQHSPMYWKERERTDGTFRIRKGSDFSSYDFDGAESRPWHCEEARFFGEDELLSRIERIIDDADRARRERRFDVSPESSDLLSELKAIVNRIENKKVRMALGAKMLGLPQ
jgi:hypothetical protein